MYESEAFENVTKEKIAKEHRELVLFGIIVCKYLKSNAIAFVKKIENNCILVGAGMGNPNRIVSIRQGIEKAKANGFTDFSEIIAVSDAFFPFSDNIEILNQHGVKTVVQPGGSIKDKEVIASCDKFAMAMVFTGVRHFNH